MNFKMRSKPTVDMDDLGRQVMAQRDLPPRTPLEYAPPHVRDLYGNVPAAAEPAIDQVERFGALPTKEIDEIVAAAEAEIANLKRDAQAVRDLYVKHTSRIAADIKRLREGVSLSMEMMGKLREQCIALDAQPPKIEKRKSTEKASEVPAPDSPA